MITEDPEPNVPLPDATTTPLPDVGPFTLYYQNVRGLRTKTNTLQKALSSCDYDVIAFTETWLRDDILDSELSLDYSFYRKDRNQNTSDLQRGGGVLIAIKNSDLIHCKPVVLPDCETLEQVVVRVTLPLTQSTFAAPTFGQDLRLTFIESTPLPSRKSVIWRVVRIPS